jgi:hypothetical protein
MGVSTELCLYCKYPLPQWGRKGGVGYHPECREPNRGTQLKTNNERYAELHPRDEYRRHAENVWRIMRSLGISRRQLLLSFPALSASLRKTEQTPDGSVYDRAWASLFSQRRAIGAGDEALARGGAIALQVQLANDRNPEARRVIAFSDEILRDTGCTGKSLELVQLWAAQRGEWMNLALAMLNHGNFLRMTTEPIGDFRPAMLYVKGAEEILRGHCRKEDPELVRIFLHEAVLLEFRIIAFHGRNPEGAQHQFQELCDLTKESQARRTHIEMRKEEIGNFSALYENDPRCVSYLVKAQNSLDQAQQLFATLNGSSALARLGTLRPQIELARLKRDKGEVRRLLDEYGTLATEPYHIGVSQDLRQRCFGVAPSRPVSRIHSNPALIYFYLEKNLVERT